jgi:hypothetical protein
MQRPATVHAICVNPKAKPPGYHVRNPGISAAAAQRLIEGRTTRFLSEPIASIICLALFMNWHGTRLCAPSFRVPRPVRFVRCAS